MRKYFLISAMAMLMANITNASEGTFNASVSIKEATEFACQTDLNFGTLVIVPTEEEFGATLTLSDGTSELSVSGGKGFMQTNGSSAECYFDEENQDISESDIILEYDETMGTAGEIIMQLYPKPGAYVSNVISIDGKLIIANPAAGDFSTVVNMYVINE